MEDQDDRRAFLTMASAGILLAACKNSQPADAGPSPAASARGTSSSSAEAPPGEEGDEVSATEDLMREHGVIRRVLVVYRESAIRLRTKASSVPPDALQKAARLIRVFGEDYHEKKLEETHLFPAVKKAGLAASRVDTLIGQHQRGREITDYVLSVTERAIGAATVQPLARVLEAFARMYEEHAAQEDTVVFPAWKKALSPKQLDEMAELFEDIEHKTFGKDGFDDAIDQIEVIERALGLELAQFTAPPPPKA
jgi:hemerythrin-like domain-containing protein